MTDDERTALVQEHFSVLQAQYPGLCLLQNALGAWIVRGTLHFSASYQALDVLDDEYTIELTLPEGYPREVPTARELLERTKGFHTYNDGTLCLGAPLAVRMAFERNPTLVGFVENCLIPYLYSFSYLNLYGKLPFGELSHGGEGILEFYQELFSIKDAMAVLGLLRILADADYRGHLECPCGSGVKVRNCHGNQLRTIGNRQEPDTFMWDYLFVLECLGKGDVRLPKSCQSKRLPNVVMSFQRNMIR